MKIFIEKIQLNNYRSCKKTTVDLNENLSALIGANGAGKSNVLNGILLLKKIALMNSVLTREDDSSLSKCRLLITFNVGGKSLRYQAIVSYATTERNREEIISTTEKWNFKDIIGTEKWLSFPFSTNSDYFRNVKRISRTSGIDYLGYLSRLMGPRVPNNIDWDTIFSTLDNVADFMKEISYYGASRFTDPSKCPTYFELENDRLARRAIRPNEDHVKFMYDLYLAYRDNPEEFNEFLSLVGANGIKLVDDIVFNELNVPSNVYQVATGGRVIQQEVRKLLIIPNIHIHGNKLSPNQLSEGTFKTLAVIFYIMTDRSQIVLLEEPEVCVHHGLLTSIVEIIKQYSQDKQIIISTHSDFVLDLLDPENVFIVNNDTDMGTVVRHIPKAMPARDYRALKEYLSNVGNLGEYWRHGELEG